MAVIISMLRGVNVGDRLYRGVLTMLALLLPLLLTAITGTLEATRGAWPGTALRVLLAYDGAASGAAYMLVEAVWEE